MCILSLHQEPDPDATPVEMESRCFHVVVEVLGLGGEPLPVFQMSLVCLHLFKQIKILFTYQENHVALQA